MLTTQLHKNNIQKGFTLIELLIVIGILGVLAAALLVALNPLEQFARGRDAGRLSTVEQLGHALQSYYTAQGSYPTANGTWQTTLTTNKELANTVSVTAAPTTCSVNASGAICYAMSGADVVVWTPVESANAKVKSTGSGSACAGDALFVYSTLQGKAGVTCVAAGATPGTGATLY